MSQFAVGDTVTYKTGRNTTDRKKHGEIATATIVRLFEWWGKAGSKHGRELHADLRVQRLAGGTSQKSNIAVRRLTKVEGR